MTFAQGQEFWSFRLALWVRWELICFLILNRCANAYYFLLRFFPVSFIFIAKFISEFVTEQVLTCSSFTPFIISYMRW